MDVTLADVAKQVGGTLEGDGALRITGVAGLEEAVPGDIAFLARPRYAAAVARTRASAVIVAQNWQGECPCARVRVKDPDRAFADAAAMLAPPGPVFAPGMHPTAVVARDAVLGRDVSVGPHCVIEPGARVGDRTVLGAGCYIGHEAQIGSDCRLYPHVSVRERVRIGNRAIVHNGAVIGSDGFGYTREGTAWKKIAQVGTVEIGDDVEIGANTTVDRARFGKTVIERGAKLDNLIQVAHNVRIGEDTAIAAQVALAGSATVGRNVQMGGQSAVTGHVTVGDNCVVAGKAGVTKDVEPGTFVSDFPAMPHMQAKRIHAHVMMLPELKKKLDELAKAVERLGSDKS